MHPVIPRKNSSAGWWLALPLILGACQSPTRPLLTEAEFDQWVVTGDAEFSYADGVLYGMGRNLPRNSFLVSPRDYADFVLEVEVRIEKGGNSGIQIRSHLDREKDRVFGYQIEIDPSDRAWSGGLYDEARRGWLDSNEGKEDARAAFHPGEWNRYRIECRGDHIRSWVNGVPCADYHDDADASGRIAFQVHGGQKADVWWRNLRIHESMPKEYGGDS